MKNIIAVLFLVLSACSSERATFSAIDIETGKPVPHIFTDEGEKVRNLKINYCTEHIDFFQSKWLHYHANFATKEQRISYQLLDPEKAALLKKETELKAFEHMIDTIKSSPSFLVENKFRDQAVVDVGKYSSNTKQFSTSWFSGDYFSTRKTFIINRADSNTNETYDFATDTDRSDDFIFSDRMRYANNDFYNGAGTQVEYLWSFRAKFGKSFFEDSPISLKGDQFFISLPSKETRKIISDQVSGKKVKLTFNYILGNPRCIMVNGSILLDVLEVQGLLGKDEVFHWKNKGASEWQAPSFILNE
jgi:hypothetical protein